MAGGVGSILGPIALGVLAERFGLASVFLGIGAVLAACLLAFWAVNLSLAAARERKKLPVS